MDKVTITLGVQAYNTIVQALQDMPWKLANPVFQEIDPQVRDALAKDVLKGPPETPAVEG